VIDRRAHLRADPQAGWAPGFHPFLANNGRIGGSRGPGTASGRLFFFLPCSSLPWRRGRMSLVWSRPWVSGWVNALPSNQTRDQRTLAHGLFRVPTRLHGRRVPRKRFHERSGERGRALDPARGHGVTNQAPPCTSEEQNKRTSTNQGNRTRAGP